jgi:glycerol uptake facilitator-like aquaporin
LYIIVQVAGCVLGAWLAHAMFELPIVQISTHARAGPAQMLSEGVATFALVFTILAVTRFRPQATAAAVALVITAGYWWTASTSFANPAITLARALSDTFAGVRPADVPGFIGAQFLGALAALGAGALTWGLQKQPLAPPETEAI